jgi:hypothetical protein
MLYRLIFLSGGRTSERVTVTEEPLVLGRDADCTVVIPDPEVARKHAVLQQKDDELFIRDLGSMNRILVNKREVRETRLKHGDEIELGRTRLVVQALMQAEVEGQAGGQRRRHRAAWAVAALLFIGTLLVLSARYVPRGGRDDETVEAAPLPAPTATTAAAKAPAPEDLRGLRDDILAIQETVKTLALKNAAAPAPTAASVLPTLPAPRSPRTPRQEAEELIVAAREAVASQHYEQADQLLAHIQHIDPEFLPAYELRAQSFETQGKRGEAAAQWSQVLQLSLESPLYQKAVAERIRLSQAAAAVPGPGETVLKIASVEQSRFQATEDYDEMRVLSIVVAPAQPGLRIEREAVRVECEFFDRDATRGDIAPTAARVTQETARPNATWARDAEQVLSATYLVPRGLRARQDLEGSPARYHGYRVRVYYRDQLQDESAMPKTLLVQEAKAAGPPGLTAPTP